MLHFRHDLGGGASLRLPHPRDAPEIFEQVERNRAFLRTWLPWVDQTRGPDDTRDFLRQKLAEAAAGQGVFTGCIEQDGAIVGGIGTARVQPEHRTVELGYWLAEDWQGRGLATRATRALVHAYLGPWGMERVEIRCATGNRPSRDLAERLGLRLEGVLRRSYALHGDLVDLAVYAVLRGESLSAEGDRALPAAPRVSR